MISKRYAIHVARLGALVLLVAAPSVQALRPFDGTDADVAKLDSFELEAGVGQARFGPQRQSSVPALVGNWGVAPDTELVLEGVMERRQGDVPAGERRTVLDGGALSLKHVFRRGSLQDEPGISFATECNLQLPSIGASPGTGFGCAAIVSQRLDWLSVHLNVALERTREHSNERGAGVILQGPDDWPLRPVAEVTLTGSVGGGREHSTLAGLVYQQSETLAFDLGVRRVEGGSGRQDEVRLGLTWSTR